MQYPTKVMRSTALEKMGFPREMLNRAYREKGQTFAWKMNPLKSNSPLVFDTDGFEKWRLQQIKLGKVV